MWPLLLLFSTLFFLLSSSSFPPFSSYSSSYSSSYFLAPAAPAAAAPAAAAAAAAATAAPAAAAAAFQLPLLQILSKELHQQAGIYLSKYTYSCKKQAAAGAAAAATSACSFEYSSHVSRNITRNVHEQIIAWQYLAIVGAARVISIYNIRVQKGVGFQTMQLGTLDYIATVHRPTEERTKLAKTGRRHIKFDVRNVH